MNDIRETLRLEKVTLVELSSYPGEKGTNHVLVLKAPLTIAAAKTLKCQDRFFTINDTAYEDFAGRITLKPIIKSCQVKVLRVSGARDSLLPTLIWKFNIGLEKDRGPSVIFRMHFDGYRGILADLLEELGTSEFPIEIEALQQNLFADAEESDGDGPAGGTRVDMSGTDERQMNLGETDDDEDADEEAKCHEDPIAVNAEEPVEAGNTLPSARAMAGGTTAAARKQRRPRGLSVNNGGPMPNLPDDPGSESWQPGNGTPFEQI